MPIPARLVVYGSDNQPLAGPMPVEDIEVGSLSGSEIHEFLHHVYTIDKGYFYALLYGVDFVRKHEPLRITKPIDKLSVLLMGYLTRGTFLPKVEIRWYEYNTKHHRETEYFRMTLEHVRLNAINTFLPDAKDPAKERYVHLETVSFCYQKITWLYTKGHLVHTDIWNGGFFAEEDEKDFSGKKEAAEDPTETPMVDKLTLKFTSGIFDEPADGFQFDKKATIKFTFEANRKPDYKENKVYAKLFAIYNGKTEDLLQINEGRLVDESSWSTEFKLKKPQSYIDDANRKADATVEYYAEIENQAAGGSFKGTSISIGSTGIALQSLSWKSDAARRDEMVSLAAEFKGCKDGEQATIEIFEYDQDNEHDPMEKIQSKITGGKLDAQWKFVYEEDTDDLPTKEETEKTGGKYNPPEYFFTVSIGDQKWGDKQESGLLEFKDWIEVELQDESGKTLADEPFTCLLADGTKQEGVLDKNGYTRLEAVHPGPVEVSFTNFPTITIKK